MDPNATYREINEAILEGDTEGAKEYSLYLLEWLDKGGAIPSAWNDSREKLYEWLIQWV